MDKKAWIIFSVIVVFVLGGLVYLSSKDNIDVSNIDANKIVAASEQNGGIGDRILGNKSSKVVLVEYGDFQCPGCSGAASKVKEITNEYKDKIAFVARNFPLTNIHPNARVAAAAAEAAGFQGKYWQMYDMVFENQDNWKDANTEERDALFTEYAVELGLKKDRFVSDLSHPNIGKKISFDQALGKKQGVTGTPTFFINGTKVNEEVTDNIIQSDGSELKKLLDEALKK